MRRALGCLRTAQPVAMKGGMDALTWFGLVAVSLMLICYAMEQRSRWWILGFAFSCGLGSAYGFLQGAWPFGLVERSGPSLPSCAGNDRKRQRPPDRGLAVIYPTL